MPQFDLYRLGGRLVVDLQTDLIGIQTTRLVAPLYTHDQTTPLKAITPTVIVDDVPWAVWVPEMAGVPQAGLGQPIGSLAPYRNDLKRAIDLLVDGV